jgi:hypothetical protein
MTRTPQRPQRRRIFLGCEGESERSYGAFLHQIKAQSGLLHIEAVLLLPGGGDPLAIIERTYAAIKRNERRYGRYAVRAVLLDNDRYNPNDDRGRQVGSLLLEGNILPIWQSPCHEALLLRHLSGCDSLRPPTVAQAMTALRRHWPDYQKGASAAYLAARIGVEHVRQAAKVEPDLAAFLVKARYALE